ncbi:MAG: Holliday junction branch migration DNA helicase RuvB [Candidatus Paceibacterota bacterium]
MINSENNTLYSKVSDPLRPKSLSDFCGQSGLKKDLNILLKAALKRSQMPDHILLSGPAGTGKTTLAAIIANELNVEMVATSSPAIEKPGDIAALLTGLRGPSLVFIDEIHRLDKKTEELLYSAMEDGILDFIVGEGPSARSVRLPIAPFTLVGATTLSGLLAGPLRDRFGFDGRLMLYSDDELSSIILRSATLLDVNLSKDAAKIIASRSRGTPRIANKILRRVRDYAQVKKGAEHVSISKRDALKALDSFGVDNLGLDSLGRDILSTLINNFSGGPVGITTLATAVGEAPQTIEEVYEPHLIRCGLIARTNRGRVAMPNAYKHLGYE